jgi:tRNA nucleotidyltransferase (CCA-adding enzyme)
MLVGGFVRDHFMGIESKDIDIEVYGLGYDEIAGALALHFRVDLVGRSFGVVKVDNEIDLSIPRRESKTGVGHKRFFSPSRSDDDAARSRRPARLHSQFDRHDVRCEDI